MAGVQSSPTLAGPSRHLTRPATWRYLTACLIFLVIAAFALRAGIPLNTAWLQAATVIFTSLLVQAVPFVMLGALVSSAIETFVPVTTIERIARLPRPLQIPAASLAGMGFPICECGSVPVARRLMEKGLVPGAAIAFMLAAPVLNPVVLISTFVAYTGEDP